MMRDCPEKEHLLGLRFGLVILDEAHKARSQQGFGPNSGEPNNLLRFMREIAARSDHVLLGTATPIQTRPEDLWDLMGILHQGKGHFVLGNDFSKWHRPREVLPILSGEQEITDPAFAWELLRSPLPLVDSTDEPRARRLYSAIRQDLALTNNQWQTSQPFTELTEETREILEDELYREIAGATFFQRENPLVRHIVLRKRTALEDAGLLTRIGVDVHPDRNLTRDPQRFDALFEGKALTAKMLLEGRTVEEETEDQEIKLSVESDEERYVLEHLIERLERISEDPKLQGVVHYLEQEKWLEHGVIIFSQYYDTARWVADALATRYPDEAIGLYAGASRSRLYQNADSVNIERETLKRMVAEHEIRIMVATDAACEGLNLQTLGTLINVDLPWNPTRLEQRIGRIKRFGQAREKVDMLNLVNEQTVDEKVYDRLSERMRDRYNLFGSLPDTIKDEWIEDIETLGEKMDEYINAQKEATGFDLRYTSTMEPSEKDWRDCTDVLSRRDFIQLMTSSWNESR